MFELDPFANSAALIASGLISGVIAQFVLRFTFAAQSTGERAYRRSAEVLTVAAVVGVATTVVGVTTFVLALFLPSAVVGFIAAIGLSARPNGGAGVPTGGLATLVGASISAVVVVAAALGAQRVPDLVGTLALRSPAVVTSSPRITAPVAVGRAVLRITKSDLGPGSGSVVIATTKEILCDASCLETTREFADGEQVALRAVNSRGSQFIGWKGAACPAADCSVTVKGTLTVSAIFALQVMSQDFAASFCPPPIDVLQQSAATGVTKVYPAAAGDRLTITICFVNRGRASWSRGALDLVPCCPVNDSMPAQAWLPSGDAFPSLPRPAEPNSQATLTYEVAVPKDARVGNYLFEFHLVEHATGALMLQSPAFVYVVNVVKAG